MHEDPKAVLYQESETCRGCGERHYFINLQVEHMVPRSKGDVCKPENYTLLCERCNSVKRNVLTLQELQQMNGLTSHA